MSRLTQTTTLFDTEEKADKFINWLKSNENDSDLGSPKYLFKRNYMGEKVIVEYQFRNEIVRGVAFGCNL